MPKHSVIKIERKENFKSLEQRKGTVCILCTATFSESPSVSWDIMLFHYDHKNYNAVESF